MTEDAKDGLLGTEHPRGLYAGLMIALLGPLIGGLMFGLMFWFYLSPKIILSPGLKEHAIGMLLPFILFSYIIVGIPAIIVAIYAGIRIGTRGWVSSLELVILSLFMPVPYFLKVELTPETVLIGLLPALMTAFTLRYLMLRWGIMKRPPNPETPANVDA